MGWLFKTKDEAEAERFQAYLQRQIKKLHQEGQAYKHQEFPDSR
jgi:hypothetical protein